MKFGTDALKGLPAVGILSGVAALAVAGVFYWDTVETRRHYLEARNFRQMAMLAGQTEEFLETRARLIDGRLRRAEHGGWWQCGSARTAVDSSLAEALGSDRVDLAWRPAPAGPAADGNPCDASTWAVNASALKAVLKDVTGFRITANPARIEIGWGGGARRLTVAIPAQQALQEILAGRPTNHPFDTLALVTPSGQVMAAVGRQGGELRATSLDRVMATGADGAFTRAASAIGMHRVRLSEQEFLLYVQPCCKGGPTSTSSTNALVLMGLVDANALRSDSMAVSPLVVLGAVVLVLVALVSWPFLKLSFANALQPVSPFDVLQLSASSVFGVALASILILGTAAYTRMRADIDGQLRELGQHIAGEMSVEMAAAYQQSLLATTALLEPACRGENATISRVRQPEQSANVDDQGRELDACTPERLQVLAALVSGRPPYPFHATVSLIDSSGQQVVKSSTSSSDLINVSRREYFNLVLDKQAWNISPCSRSETAQPDERTARAAGLPDAVAGCVLEPVWSWGARGKLPQAVLAHPTGSAALPVAAITVAMRSVIDPVLPEGFEFAVVHSSGEVLFHSDPHRIGQEDLVVETDGNPRIRALMSSRSAGEVSTTYLGRDYRAHVRPAPIPGASVVTLFDKQTSRALAIEWMTASLLLLTGYMALWMLAMLGVMWRGTAWLWPDPFRRSRYRYLSWGCSLPVIGFFSAYLFASRDWALTAGLALPALVGIAVWLVLALRPPGVSGKHLSMLHREYRVMAALLLVVAGVVPGVAFAAYSYDSHIESFVKHRQLAYASREIARIGTELAEGPARVRRYQAVVYGMYLENGPWPLEDGLPPGGHEHRGLAQLLLEDVLPYPTPLASEIRELQHDRSEDGAWRSFLAPASPWSLESGTLAVSVWAGAGRGHVAVSSRLPTLVAVRSHRPAHQDGVSVFVDEPYVVWWTVLSLAIFLPLGFVIWWIAGFLLRKIFLPDVIDKAWVKGRVGTSAGQHLLVLCRDPAAVAQKVENAEVIALTRFAREREPIAALQALIAQAPLTRAFVVHGLDVDDGHYQGVPKLRIVEWLMTESDRTVVLLAKQSPAEWKAYVDALVVEPDTRATWRQLFEQVKLLQLPDDVQNAEEPLTVTVSSPADHGGRSMVSWRRWLSERVNSSLVSVWTQDSKEGRQALLAGEGRPTRALRGICSCIAASEEMQADELNEEQILDEVAEQARPLYQAAWRECTEDERIVLEHVARFGLSNAASAPTVRRLLKRGLLRKDPELQVMNETFRRFVVAPERRQEVERLESEAEPSIWDRVRFPLAAGATIAVIFLVTTQREMFDATVTVAAGVTTAVPTLLRLTTVLAQWGSGGPKDVRNA